MKKRIAALLIFSALLISAGCTPNYQNDENASTDESGYIIVEPAESKPLDNKLIERKEVSDLSVPEASVSVQQAADLLYTCSLEDMYLPESANTYKAFCTGIVDYKNSDYYSFYLNYDTGKEKITVGTHYLVSVNGETVRKKTWLGQYETVKTGSASSDKTVKERFPDAQITPNEALKVLAEKKASLDLENPFSDYIFELTENIYEINGVSCYNYTPKLEYTDHTDVSGGFFVSTDGSLIFGGLPDSQGHYTEIK